MANSVLSDQDYGGVTRILGLPDPTAPQQPATRAYVDSAIEGLAPKDSVRVATTGNVNLASPGGTIDTIALANGDRVLVKSQTAGAENGLYIWTGAATPMTRSNDANTFNELEAAIVSVEEGTANAGTTWRQTSVNGNLGTTAIAWVPFGTGVSPASETTAGIAEVATQAETDTGTDDTRILTPAKLAGWGGRFRQFVQTIGDGAATQYDVTHNFGHRNIEVQVWETSGSFRRVDAGLEIQQPTPNTVRFLYAAAPALNAHNVVIHARSA